MFSRITLISLLFIVNAILTQAIAQTLQYQDSPFGFHPAMVVLQETLKNSYAHAVDIGVKWDRNRYFIWTNIQPDINKQQFRWHDDDYFTLLTPNSMRRMANIVIGYPEEFGDKYLDYGKSMKSFLPKDENAYKLFVKAVVERYDGDGKDDMPELKNPIKYWQIDNEPGLAMAFGKEDYAELLKMAYGAVKEADPDAKVIIGGDTGYPPASSYLKFSDRDFLPILEDLAIDGKRYFDIFDFHWYGNATGDYLGAKEVYNHIKSQINSLKLPPPEEYWITEMGTYSGDPDQPAPSAEPDAIPLPYQSEKQQASDIVKRHVYSLSFGIKKIFPAFGLLEGFRNIDGYFSYTGLIYDGKFNNDLGRGVKKLSYYTYKKMVEVLEGSDWKNIATIQEQDGIYIFKFTKQGTPIWVAWNDSSVTRTVTISGITTNRVKATEAVPKYESGKDVADYTTAFRTDTLVVTNGAVMLTLGVNPVFVEAFTVTSVEEEGENIPEEFVLYQNFPNPFNPETKIGFTLDERTNVSIKIFNVQGELVKTLTAKEYFPGNHEIIWNGKNELGQQQPAGIYFYEMRSGSYAQAKKMILLR